MKRVAMALMVMWSMYECSIATVYADLGDTASNAIWDVIDMILKVVMPIGMLCGVICLLEIVISKDEKKVGQAKSWGLRIVIGLVAIGVIRLIAGGINTFISNAGGQTLPNAGGLFNFF